MIEPNRNGGFKRHESVDYISMKLIVWKQWYFYTAAI